MDVVDLNALGIAELSEYQEQAMAGPRASTLYPTVQIDLRTALRMVLLPAPLVDPSRRN